MAGCSKRAAACVEPSAGTRCAASHGSAPGSCDQWNSAYPSSIRRSGAAADARDGTRRGAACPPGRRRSRRRPAAGDEHLVVGDVLPVLPASRGARVAAGEETGAAGRADRALAQAVLEDGSRRGEAVEIRRADERVPVATQRVPVAGRCRSRGCSACRSSPWCSRHSVTHAPMHGLECRWRDSHRAGSAAADRSRSNMRL